jgi:hypothetical protein
MQSNRSTQVHMHSTTVNLNLENLGESQKRKICKKFPPTKLHQNFYFQHIKSKKYVT